VSIGGSEIDEDIVLHGFNSDERAIRGVLDHGFDKITHEVREDRIEQDAYGDIAPGFREENEGGVATTGNEQSATDPVADGHLEAAPVKTIAPGFDENP